MVAFDIIKLPRASSGATCCLVIMDLASRWARIYPLKQCTGLSIRNAFEKYLSSIPACPLFVLADNATVNRSDVLNQFFDSYGIKRIYSSAYQAHTNGLVERMNQSLLVQLRALGASTTNWEAWIPKIVINHNHTVNRTTGRTPASFIYSSAHEFPQGYVLPKSMTQYWHTGNPTFAGFKEGDDVLKRCHYVGNVTNDKLKQRYTGPFVVKKVRGNGVTYDLETPEGEIVDNIHYDDLRSFRSPPEWLRTNIAFQPFYRQWMRRCVGSSGAEDPPRPHNLRSASDRDPSPVGSDYSLPSAERMPLDKQQEESLLRDFKTRRGIRKVGSNHYIRSAYTSGFSRFSPRLPSRSPTFPQRNDGYMLQVDAPRTDSNQTTRNSKIRKKHQRQSFGRSNFVPYR